ncbi:MAG: TolC family protein [Candidatus Riflebacteria bacterium]|nr:TolC family protein [Candidatus Riflebacteria bacterium]
MATYRNQLFFALFALFVLFCRPAALFSQESNGLTILLESCLQKNPELSATYHRWKAAESAIIHKTALADPVVNFRQNIEPVQTRTGEQKQTLTISQMLPFPGKQKAAIRLNHQLSQNEKLLYEMKLRDLVSEIKKSYAEIWFLQHATETTEANAKIVEFLAAEATANTSSASMLPVLRAQSQLAQSANDQINYSELLESEKARLIALTGLQTLDSQWFTMLPQHKIASDEKELIEQALVNRTEIAVAENSQKIAATKLRLAHFDNKPDFTIGYSKNYTGNRPDLGNMYLKDEGKDSYGFFVQMNLPVWGSKNRSRTKEAREKQSEADALLTAEKDKTRVSFIKLWYSMANRKRLHQLYSQTILPQAQTAADTAQSTFTADKSKFSDYLEAMTTVYAIKIAALRAEADYFISASELEKWIGTPFEIQSEETLK